MSSSFNRSNIDHYLYLIAKEYKKMNRANPNAEIIIVGGASMIINYSFRNLTTDIDSIIMASSSMKDVINKIGDEHGLDAGWFNEDFKRTNSYSSHLVECSKFYKTFCGCLNVRTVAAEYLLAMKVRSFRSYKHDLSDIVGIVKEHQEMNKRIDFETLEKAYLKLYEEVIPLNLKIELQKVFENEDLEELYYSTKEREEQNYSALLKAEEIYENEISEQNLDSFIRHFSTEISKEERGNSTFSDHDERQ